MSLPVLSLIPLDSLDDNPIQPAVRTVDAAMRELRTEHAQSGYIRPIDAVKRGRRYVKADGHRRCRLAEELGHTHVECFVHPEGTDPVLLFKQLNRGVRKISGAEWFNMWSLEEDKKEALKTFPKGHAKNIRKIVDWIGVRDAATMADGHTAPGIALTVEKVVKLQTIYGTGATVLRPGDVLRWMQKHKAQNDTTRFIAKRIVKGTNGQNNAKRLLKAIANNQPVPEFV